MFGWKVLGFLSLVVAPVVGQSQRCNADNCYRQVLGNTRTQSASNVADCSRRLVCSTTSSRITVTSTLVESPTVTTTVFTTPPTSTTITTSTPDTSTSTQLVTVTTTVTPVTTVVVSTFSTFAKRFITEIAKRQASACPNSAVPTYASSCGNFARYSSACSCAGVTETTVTGPNATPTSTIFRTITSTQTATATVGVPTSTTTITVTAPTSTVTSTTTVATATTTLTDTTSTTVTTTPAALPTLCGNSGIGWGYWRDYQPAGNDAFAQSYDPTTHKLENPSGTGVTLYAHINTFQDGRIYGQSLPVNDFMTNQRAYVYAAETGTYTFTASFVDDIVEAWIGPQAYSGWSAANRQILAYQPSPRTVSFTSFLTGGTYTPFRFILKNAGGPGYVDFIIRSPSGRQIFSTASPGYVTAEVVQYSCPGVVPPALAFPPFGQET